MSSQVRVSKGPTSHHGLLFDSRLSIGPRVLGAGSPFTQEGTGAVPLSRLTQISASDGVLSPRQPKVSPPPQFQGGLCCLS